MKKKLVVIFLVGIAIIFAAVYTGAIPENNGNENISEEEQGEELGEEEIIEEEEEAEPQHGLSFEYPDAVRGIYVTGHSAGGSRLNGLIDYVNETDLNSMVIDVKDDWGYITFKMEDTPYEEYSKNYIGDIEGLLERLAENNIYPIARIVVFKDTVLAEKYPEYSFLQGEVVWRNNRNEAFTNPYLKDVWEHNLDIAEKAAELGFQEIQFDYVRFPEGFETRDEYLAYSQGEYGEEDLVPRLKREWDNIPVYKRPVEPPEFSYAKARVTAVTDFVEYAYERLNPMGVDVSVDIFGYTATTDAPGIGQDFIEISRHVDIICSMIYPSHWGVGYFNIPKPDLEPYRLVQEYAKAENERLSKLENPPVSRPWIQDFTATWLRRGNYLVYGAHEVEAQIRALNEAGIDEYLIWNASNRYTTGVDYKPLD